ncbi:MAG TPA: protein kinase [Gemmataceae bacterium]|nr:protein kinase [Gemmataceae bacterium]
MSEKPTPDDLLDEQRERWQRGERKFVEAYLEQHPSFRSDRAFQLDLIYNEIVLRESIGEKPRHEEYLHRFPHLREELLLQFELEGALDWKLAGASGSAIGAEPESVRPTTLFPQFPGFEISGIIGHGGAGVVYSARHTGRSAPIALKVLLAGPVDLMQLHSEMESLKRLGSRHVVHVHQISSHEGRVYAATELLEDNLSRRMNGAPVPARQAAQWLETLARTLQLVHALGIVHGNLKPSNVLFDRNDIPKISDFGLARVAVQTIALLGPACYLAPEQLDGSTRPPSPATDIYGLGAVLYEMLTGRPPFFGPKLDALMQAGNGEPLAPTQLHPNVPHDLETICLACLHKDPQQRLGSAAALADELSAFIGNRPIRTRRGGLPAIIRHMFAGIWGTSAHMRRLLEDATRQRLRAERSAAQTRLLLDLTRRLMSVADLQSMLPLLTEVVAWLADAEHAAIYFLDRQRGELWTRALSHDASRKNVLEEVRIKLSDAGITGAVVTVKEPIHLADARTDPGLSPDLEQRLGGRRLGLLALPLVGGNGAVLGVAQLVNRREGKFSSDSVEILTALLASTAIACDHALARDRRAET